MGVLTFEGREPATIRFLVFSHKERYTRARGTSGLRDLSETCALRRAKLVFMANYPLKRREDL